MSQHFRVLSISADPLLFETRNRVLQHAGFEVVPCFRGDNAEDAMVRSQVDAVVIGDSVGPQHKVALINIFRAVDPRVAIVVVYPVGERTADVRIADAAVESLDGPEELIRTVHAAIGKKKPASAKPMGKAANAGH